MTDDNVTVTEEDMVAGVDGLMNMAGSYRSSIDVLKETIDLAGAAFEDIGNSPQKSWEGFRDAIWTCLAESQDALNRAAEDLASYADETFNLDGENAETIRNAANFEDADMPGGK